MRTKAPTWVEFGRLQVEYDECYSLAGCIQVPLVEAAGYIGLLCALGIAEADDSGQIDHLTTKYIESACYWPGERGALVNAFCEAGILLGVHESDNDPLRISPVVWDRWAGKQVKERIAARERQRKHRNESNKNS